MQDMKKDNWTKVNKGNETSNSVTSHEDKNVAARSSSAADAEDSKHDSPRCGNGL